MEAIYDYGSQAFSWILLMSIADCTSDSGKYSWNTDFPFQRQTTIYLMWTCTVVGGMVRQASRILTTTSKWVSSIPPHIVITYHLSCVVYGDKTYMLVKTRPELDNVNYYTVPFLNLSHTTATLYWYCCSIVIRTSSLVKSLARDHLNLTLIGKIPANND